MENIPPWVTAIAVALTFAINAALAAVIASQIAPFFKRLPSCRASRFAAMPWLPLIPIFNVLWIWVVMVTLTCAVNPQVSKGTIWALAISACALYTLLFLLGNPNFGLILAIILFIPYRKRLNRVMSGETPTGPNKSEEPTGASA